MVQRSEGNTGIEPKTARLVLVTLMTKTHEMARTGSSVDELVSHIQSEHCLNKKTAKDIASMYLELFNDENKKVWKEATEVGFYPCSAEACLTFTGSGDID